MLDAYFCLCLVGYAGYPSSFQCTLKFCLLYDLIPYYQCVDAGFIWQIKK